LHQMTSKFGFKVNSTSRRTTCGLAQILSTQVLLIATLPLADNTDATDRSANPHHFLYARVLGVYHANIIYTGSGKRDVNPASSFAM